MYIYFDYKNLLNYLFQFDTYFYHLRYILNVNNDCICVVIKNNNSNTFNFVLK